MGDERNGRREEWETRGMGDLRSAVSAGSETRAEHLIETRAEHLVETRAEHLIETRAEQLIEIRAEHWAAGPCRTGV